VDDQPYFLTLGQNLLRPRGYAVQTASSGREALQAAQAAPRPEVILLDVAMPGMDGFETCRRLKADPATANIPVVILTASTDHQVMQKAFAAGAAAAILKSMSTERLLNMLQLVFSTQQQAAGPQAPAGPAGA
jgi:putative two-component system response regulator